MLPKSRRLRAKDFKNFSSAQFARGPHLSVRCKKVDNVSPTRFAALAPRRVLSGAADRNRMRRRLYEAVRSVLGGVSDGFIVAVSAKADAAALSAGALRAEVADLLKQAGLLRRE